MNGVERSNDGVILDSGNRTEFPTGAVRDIQEDKGRFDLLPLDVVADLLKVKGVNPAYAMILYEIEEYKETKSATHLEEALFWFFDADKLTFYEALHEVSLQYRDGAEKYGENNWQKGLPVKSYLSSAVRHLQKHIDGQVDEAHHRGFIWNILGVLWTIKHKPELIDASFDMSNELQNGSETQHSETNCCNMEHIQKGFERVM